MKYLPDIHTAQDKPEQLEQLFQAARKENAAAEFKADLLACYDEAPENVLYAAWFYRLQQASEAHESEHRHVNWKLAVPLSILTAHTTFHIGSFLYVAWALFLLLATPWLF